MTTDKKMPWGKWVWGDWRKDARLHMCSYAARGLWADMLNLMGDECDHFGVLILNGVALAAPHLAGTFGGSAREVGKLLAELEAAKVFSRVMDAPDDVTRHLPEKLPDHTIVSRRMIRDKAKAEADRENGKRGGNPLLKGPENPSGKPVAKTTELTGGDKAQKLEARNQKPDTPIAPKGDFEAFWQTMPKRGGAPNPKGLAKERYQKLIASGVDPDELLRAAKSYAAYCRKSGAIDTDKVQQVTTFIGVKETWRQYAGDGPLLDAASGGSSTAGLTSTASAIIQDMRDRGDLPLKPAAKSLV